MEIALDISYTDWPREGPEGFGIRDVQAWREQTWGERGFETVMDTALAFGTKVINFRVHAPGPMWPSKVAETWPFNWGEDSRRRGLKPDMAEWNMVEAGVKAAHRKGLKVLGWFDMTEGHAGLPTAWAMNHPEFCIVNRDGVRLDGPVGMVGKDGTRFDKSMVWMGYDDLIKQGFMDIYCTRPDGTSIDPLVSMACPEVVEHRLALLKEMLDFDVDGLFLVACFGVGCEKPSTDRFKQKYGLDPHDVPETDPRWIEHQRFYFTDYFRKVRDLIRQKEKSAGRKIEFIVEGQGGIPTPGLQAPEIGCKTVPNWAAMPAYIDVETLAREKIVDTLAFWTLREMDALSPEVRRNIKLATRYRFFNFEEFTEENYKARIRETEKRGVSLFLINENRGPLALCPWMYPGKPGPLYELTQRLKGQGS